MNDAQKGFAGCGGNGGLIAVILIFGVGNLVLWGAQEVAHAPEMAKLKAMEEELARREPALSAQELKLKELEVALQTSASSISTCKSGLAAFERQAVDGTLPAGVFAKYETKLAECNTLVDRHNAVVANGTVLAAEYDVGVAAYNDIVATYNSLAATAGTRIVLIPGRNGRAPKH